MVESDHLKFISPIRVTQRPSAAKRNTSARLPKRFTRMCTGWMLNA